MQYCEQWVAAETKRKQIRDNLKKDTRWELIAVTSKEVGRIKMTHAGQEVRSPSTESPQRGQSKHARCLSAG